MIPVGIENSGGVTSLDLTFSYDPAILMATGVFPTAFTDAFTLTPDLSTAGVVSLSMSSAIALAGAEDQK